MEALVKNGADVNSCTDSGASALHVACQVRTSQSVLIWIINVLSIASLFLRRGSWKQLSFSSKGGQMSTSQQRQVTVFSFSPIMSVPTQFSLQNVLSFNQASRLWCFQAKEDTWNWWNFSYTTTQVFLRKWWIQIFAFCIQRMALSPHVQINFRRILEMESLLVRWSSHDKRTTKRWCKFCWTMLWP